MQVPFKQLFITAIGTDSGKTVVSAILTKALSATYWKPIQCGLPADTDMVRSLIGNDFKTIPERYRLQTPASPHFAAQKEKLQLHIEDFQLPSNQGHLIIEGAGGLLVPLNKNQTMADLAFKFNLPMVLVINHYLGSINHSLLTIAEIKRRNLKLEGIIFNGLDFQDAESIILEMADCKCMLRLPVLTELNEKSITEQASRVIWN